MLLLYAPGAWLGLSGPFLAGLLSGMTDDRRWQLLEDVIEAVVHGEVAGNADTFSIRRMSEEPEIEVTVGDHATVYRITVSRSTRPADG
ncbi:hypothetical protein [Micromonospora sp. NPDC005174]|uniref:hypothetical protein n=1 Tax=unclassified Micromonospora TaxID=2617518 RepID=UPI0033A3C042